jgi:hypothetical protein
MTPVFRGSETGFLTFVAQPFLAVLWSAAALLPLFPVAPPGIYPDLVGRAALLLAISTRVSAPSPIGRVRVASLPTQDRARIAA